MALWINKVFTFFFTSLRFWLVVGSNGKQVLGFAAPLVAIIGHVVDSCVELLWQCSIVTCKCNLGVWVVGMGSW